MAYFENQAQQGENTNYILSKKLWIEVTEFIFV